MFVRRMLAGVAVACLMEFVPAVHAQCLGDVNGDGVVEAEDLAAVLFAWGPCTDCDADIDANGVVDASDIASVISAWGHCAPAITAVTPNAGPSVGGAMIVITGTDFRPPVSVEFGGVAATSVNLISTTQLTAVTPPGTTGPATVSVTSPWGTGSLAGG